MHRRFEHLSKADVDRILMAGVCGGVLNSGETLSSSLKRNKTAARPTERTSGLFKVLKCFVSLSRKQIHVSFLFTQIWVLCLSLEVAGAQAEVFLMCKQTLQFKHLVLKCKRDPKYFVLQFFRDAFGHITNAS